MADEAAPQAPDAPKAEAPPSEPAKKSPPKFLLPIVVALTTLLGGVVGVVVVAPRLVAAREAAAAKKAQEAEAKEQTEGAGETEKGGERRPLVKIDNLIVNPAGSQGSRFLMVSVAVAAANAEMEAEIRAREPQIRDVLIALLERQTMDALSQPGARDSLKRAMSDTISALAAHGAKLQVFLPQFVIQ